MTPPAPPPSWSVLLDRLMGSPADPASGAELRVSDPDGTPVYRAALARHWRLEPGHPATVWLRPIAGATAEASFSLNACRRRGLTFARAAVEEDSVRFELVTGQTARVSPIGPDLRPELDRWDTFIVTVLPADVELELDELLDDSWHGPWA